MSEPPPRPTEGPQLHKRKKKRVGPLSVTEVRWMYKRGDEQKFIPFRGYDSVVIELHYRKKLNIPLDKKDEEMCKGITAIDDVIVMDSLYKLDFDSDYSKITSIYWKDDVYEIRRGSWFVEQMQPLAKEFSDLIEDHHLKNFRGEIIAEGPAVGERDKNKPPLTVLQCFNDEIKWSSVTDVGLFSSNAKGSKIWRYLTFSKIVPLHRGYQTEADPNEGKREFTDLMFVVHGIGQKNYESLIAKNTHQMRELLLPMVEKSYKSSPKQLILLPIEWRSNLILDNDLSSNMLLSRMNSVRQSLNSIAMDIFYYQSFIYRSEIVNGVVSQLNSVYSTFMAHNPNFKGKISIFAHSLGSVIVYDILSGFTNIKHYDNYITDALDQKKETMPDEDKINLENYLEARKKLFAKDDIKTIFQEQKENLKFKVQTLFCVGSPLGVFLVMRGATADTFNKPNPNLERIVNIFHPLDPVAYRLEPMYHANYRYIKPVKIFSTSDEKAHTGSYKSQLELIKGYAKKKKQEQTNSHGSGADVKSDNTENFENGYDSDDESVGNSTPRSQSPVNESLTSITIAPTSAEKIEDKSETKDEELSKEVVKDGNKDSAVSVKQTSGWFSKKRTERDGEKKMNKTQKETDKAKESEKSKEAEKSKATLEQLDTSTDLTSIVSKIPPQYVIQNRIDYQVQPSLTDKSYLGLLRGHFSYWTNPDVVAFIANYILTEREEDFGEIENVLTEELIKVETK
uniref:DDHD domain-containing protein n=1 Tax=Rhabditophanes sp. KR3021 TaxID=114890 RepID=A0AC35TI67_9BILA